MAKRGRKSNVERESPEKALKQLTAEQRGLIEMVRTGRHDPVFFAANVLGVELHPKQQLWMWMTTKTQTEKSRALFIELGIGTGEYYDGLVERNPDMLKNILVPSNRWGKTLVTSVKHIWYNFYKIGATGTVEHIAATRCGTLNLSPHSNQAQASYEYILDILFSKFTYSILVDGKRVSKVNKCLIGDFYLGDSKQLRQISFKNGTNFRAIPTGEDQASSLAGMRFLYISYDECAQSLHLKAELPAKIMSRLIDFGGALDLISTPEVDKPSHQYFYHLAKLGMKGEDGWFTLIGNLMDNIFLGEKEKESIGNMIRTTDPTKYRQVVYGEFVTTGKKMFDSILVERLWDEDVPRMPMVGRKYVLWADWGFADTGDPTVFYVIDYTPVVIAGKTYTNRYRVVFRESIRGGSPFTVLARFRMLQREWNGARAGHDSGNMGGIMVRKMLLEMGMSDLIDFSATGDKGDMLFCLLVVMSDGRKASFDSEGKVVDENPEFGRLRSYHIPELEEQMGNYQYNPDKGVSDKKIEQDDVMCLGMAVWWLERKHNKNSLKVVNFNPLAPSAELMFTKMEAQKIAMHTITIPEKRIM